MWNASAVCHDGPDRQFEEGLAAAAAANNTNN